MNNKTCGNCKFFNGKLSVIRHWGECQNETVQNRMRLSLKLVNLNKNYLNEVEKYTRIQFDEDLFGCGFFKADSKTDENKALVIGDSGSGRLH